MTRSAHTPKPQLPDRICLHCALPFSWRKKWASVWGRVRFCSDRCRRAHSPRRKAAIETAIIEHLAQRSGTICPSEVSRSLYPDRWREQMKSVRCAARRLEARQVIDIRQKGRRVDPADVRGPIRLGRGDRFANTREH